MHDSTIRCSDGGLGAWTVAIDFPSNHRRIRRAIVIIPLLLRRNKTAVGVTCGAPSIPAIVLASTARQPRPVPSPGSGDRRQSAFAAWPALLQILRWRSDNSPAASWLVSPGRNAATQRCSRRARRSTSACSRCGFEARRRRGGHAGLRGCAFLARAFHPSISRRRPRSNRPLAGAGPGDWSVRWLRRRLRTLPDPGGQLSLETRRGPFDPPDPFFLRPPPRREIPGAPKAESRLLRRAWRSRRGRRRARLKDRRVLRRTRRRPPPGGAARAAWAPAGGGPSSRDEC